ncbi:hypothetical protein [Fluoribacter gormanii]|uniref:hypothetical protein n=1 Tax=Fluoribacter gormanii TaxID=464 RepID=UPI0010418FCF|nr:hypothetical protein [Fluoribacter gormanii]
MCDTKQIQALKYAAKEKHAVTMERVLAALKIMQEQNVPINFESVASFAQVSKTWVYSQPSLKEQIKNIKNNTKNKYYMKNQDVKIKTQEKKSIYYLGRINY